MLLVGGGVGLVVPVEGKGTYELLATRGHDVVLLNWNHENATFTKEMNGSNITVIASVETKKDQESNRWNDGKADAKGRLWAGEQKVFFITLIISDHISYFILYFNKPLK